MIAPIKSKFYVWREKKSGGEMKAFLIAKLKKKK